MRSRLAEITRFTEEFEWLDAGSRGWTPSHWTEWPSVLHQALNRLAELPETAHHQVTGTVEAWSVATLGMWELSHQIFHEGVHRIEGAGHEARSEIEAAASGLSSALHQAGRLLPGPLRRD
jgi:hypothetical protein